MRRNLNATHGLIMAESVTMALAPKLGKDRAHHAVEHACTIALEHHRPLVDVLASDPAVTEHLNRPELERLTDPASYVGESHAIVDRVLARYAALA
jgi:3-carboxy-cis,cis-muconate cycloisomerase